MDMYTTKKISAIPRSRESTRMITCSAATAEVMSTSFSSLDFWNRDATKKTNSSFTNSDGCTVTPAIVKERLAP